MSVIAPGVVAAVVISPWVVGGRAGWMGWGVVGRACAEEMGVRMRV